MQDEEGLESGWNPYAYAGNDPVNHIDPDGLHPIYWAAASAALAYDSIVSGEPPQASGAKVAGKAVDGIGVLAAKEYAKRVKNQAQVIKNATNRADRLSRLDRSGKDFTKAGKEAVKGLNRVQNNGRLICSSPDCGKTLVDAQKSIKGVSPSRNEAHVDHIQPKSHLGSGTPNKGQVLCGPCNISKSNK